MRESKRPGDRRERKEGKQEPAAQGETPRSFQRAHFNDVARWSANEDVTCEEASFETGCRIRGPHARS
jgi:hypothetical protein